MRVISNPVNPLALVLKGVQLAVDRETAHTQFSYLYQPAKPKPKNLANPE
jgi:hypothetical protein